MSHQLPEEKRETLAALKFLLKYRKIYLFLALFSALGAVIVTFFLPKQYFSYGIVFANQNNTLESAVENPVIGYDVEADRLIQVLESKEIKDTLIRRFDLVNYYELDTTDQAWYDELQKNMYRDISVKRTPYMSVLISATTEEPTLSANLVNTMIDMANTVRSRLLKSNILTGYDQFKAEYEMQQAVVDELVDSISALRVAAGNPNISLVTNHSYVITDMIKRETKANPLLEQKVNEYFREHGRLNELKNRYERSRLQMERPIPSIYIVDRARPSYKKTSPSYVINLLVVVGGTLLFGTVYLYVRERLKDLLKLLQ